VEEIGEKLRRTRQEKGLTLEEARSVTKIRLRYLQALEAGEFDCIPGEVYAKGFLRSYANFLGLDGQELVEEFKRLKKEQGEEEREKEAGQAPRERLHASSIGWLAGGVLIILVAIVLLFLGFKESEGLHEKSQSGLHKVGSQGDAVAGEEKEDAPGGSGLAEDTTSQNPDGPRDGWGAGVPTDFPPVPRLVKSGQGEVVYQVYGEEIELSVEAKGRCWLRVVSDGEEVFVGTLEPGQALTWSARQALEVRFGNPGAVFLQLNGQKLGAAGPPEYPLNFRVTRQERAP